ncbi:putative dna repair protein [Erysiphe necator]|uniref:Putative dna repair protein n=1 Tax=Uncinula necator TaxID=52586 RepID=A0A0B1PHA4_UNCNE|nr:putative dna repair protein [Erysiphe necator]
MVNKRKLRVTSKVKDEIPNVYQEMLAEALPLQNKSSSTPLKRRKIRQQRSFDFTEPICDFDRAKKPGDLEFTRGREPIDARIKDENIENEDKVKDNLTDHNYQDIKDLSFHINESHLVEPTGTEPNLISPVTQQTMYREIDEDSDETDCDWENVGLGDDEIEEDTSSGKFATGDLELSLSKALTSQEKCNKQKRKGFNKEDRLLRLAIHKMHVLCLLSYLDLRNHWCNDIEVQDSLRPYITPDILRLLKPRSELSQFSRTESLKRGLTELVFLWKTKFCITERGIRRALWIDDEKNLQHLKVPDNIDSIIDKTGFYKAAAAPNLQGSRDLGAQLFCALLRSVEIETRLVCSLQPLPIKVGRPFRTYTPPKCVSEKKMLRNSKIDMEIPLSSSSRKLESDSNRSSLFLKPLHRLGHPNATDYHMPKISNTPPLPMPKTFEAKTLHESPHPIFWVEIFDKAHQKWIPVDPLVTQSVSRSRVFEPSASDRENNMSYVIAFDKEGYAKDVTRRYVKAYNGKTRKLRVESTSGGEKWWAKVMCLFSRGWCNNADQIENIELAAIESKEPMPKNIADFKGHSYFVLERHLHRNEILVNAKECGRIAAGRVATKGTQKKMEKVFRRKDVQVAKSANSWYQLGLVVKLGEQPIKTIQSNRKIQENNLDEVTFSKINLYLKEQTEVYLAPPVVNGLVPKNSFGNIDMFVPSMLPRGAAYIADKLASEAAKLLGIDYAHALTGFNFHGRHGTAILNGIVVAEEYSDAVRAIIEGFKDELIEAQEQIHSQIALRTWKRFIIALRIKQRVDSYQVQDEIANEDNLHHQQKAMCKNKIDNSSEVMGNQDIHNGDNNSIIEAGGFLV